MYELIQAAQNTYYIDCPAKIGLYRISDTEVVLIDSGNDKEAGKKVLRHLNANGWTLRAIFNTHSNADHIGGNRLLQERTGCAVYAPGMEAAFTRNPILEPSFLYGGFPPKPLCNKFLLAKESDVLPLTADMLPEGLEMFPLKGHFFDMVGFKTADNVWFLADCLSSEQVLGKYHVSFIYDVEEYLRTLDWVDGLPGGLFVPSHAKAVSDIRPLVDVNRNKVLKIMRLIVKLCASPLCFEELLKQVFDHYSLALDFNQYVLVGSTIRSYLSCLMNRGLLEVSFAENRLTWQSLCTEQTL
ncbi:MAG: MBL fold metallo-hydrolase [Clostridiales bacterium]|nr:MBL fold metallo-hydrolase [Clostridiales bacterium]